MKLIKINTEHYVVVDETIQPVNDYYYDSFINKIKNTNGAEYGEASHCWQITHSTKGKYKQEYISLEEVKELIGEVNVEKKAELYVWGGVYLTEQEKQQTEIAYMTGYNQALEDNKEKKYTQQELIWAIQEAYGHGQDDEFDGVNKIEESIKAITKHIQAKTEWEVEVVDGKLKLK